MKLIDSNSISTLQKNVATIGFFDGVHLGHQYLLGQVKEIARSKQIPSAVITFPIHPRKVLQSHYQPALLCGYDEKYNVYQIQVLNIVYRYHLHKNCLG